MIFNSIRCLVHMIISFFWIYIGLTNPDVTPVLAFSMALAFSGIAIHDSYRVKDA